MNWTIKQRLNFYTSEFRPPALPEDIARLPCRWICSSYYRRWITA